MATLNHLEQLSKSFDNSSRMPVLFLGHGSPMNAIEDNEFVREFKALGERLDRPNAIVVVSAHWETTGTLVTVMNQPRTIHDFGGFPQALYDVQYPAPGHPELANDIAKMVEPENTIALDERWGLDHGSWTVVRHLFPKANVPVIQLSLDRTKPAKYHYELAQQLKKLRNISHQLYQFIMVIQQMLVAVQLPMIIGLLFSNFMMKRMWILPCHGLFFRMTHLKK